MGSYSPTVFCHTHRNVEALEVFAIGKAQFYRIWREDSLIVVLIKGWWHKGELRTCKGEGIEV